MATDREFLLVKKNPYPGESWAGFLLRLSDANGFPSLHWLVGYAEGGALQSTDASIAAMFRPPTQQRLTELFDSATISLGSLRRPNSRVVGRLVNIVWRDVEIPSTQFRLGGAQICPHCVAESGFLREEWDFASFTACPTHRVRLIDTCPACEAPLSWRRSRLAYCNCGHDLQLAKTTQASECSLKRSEHLARALAEETKSNDLTTITERIEVQRRMLGVFLGRAGSQLDSMQLDAIGNKKLHDLLDFTEGCFERWPLVLYQTLDSLIAARTLKHSQASGDAFLKSLISEFPAASSTNTPTAELWSNALAAYRPAAVSDELPSAILEAIDFGRQEVTMAETAQILNVSSGGLARLVKYGKLKPTAETEASRRKKFRRDDVARLADLSVHLVDGIAAARLLGVKAPSLRRLVIAGHVPAWQGPTVDGYSRYIFDARVIAQFIDKFDALPITTSTDVAMPDYTRCMLSRVNVGVVGLVDAVLSGRLPIARFERRIGIAGLQFSKLELDRFIEAQSLQVESHIELTRLAKDMGLYYEALLRLARAGHFVANKIRLPSGATALAVAAAEAERIKGEFIFPRELGLRLGKFPSWAARCLVASGVNPMSGPRIDGGQIYVFRRSEVEALDLEMVMSIKLPRSWHKKKPARVSDQVARTYLTTGEVAKRLGTSAQGVLRLQRQGFLSGTKRKLRSVVQATFEIEQVEQYLEKFQRNPALVTVEQAASRLGLSGAEFFFGWIRSGRLARIKSGLDEYVGKADLERAERDWKDSLSVRDAAKLLGKPACWIKNRIRTREIPPCSGPGVDQFGTYRISKHVVDAMQSDGVSQRSKHLSPSSAT